jgi:hypothetical protein
MNSTGAFQVPPESKLVPDAALMAPVPQANIAMSSNSALTVLPLPSSSENLMTH